MEQNAAADMLGVEPSILSRFDDVLDHFNNTTLSGWICRGTKNRYGSLVLDRINGLITPPQRILGTPKQRYPFGRCEDEVRKYNWPREVLAVKAYTKYDGTNIFVYPYRDHNGEWRVTAKTRLTPTLKRTSTYGDFFKLWNLIVGVESMMFKVARAAATGNIVGLSFELYGYRNHHTVSYSTPLSAVLLFGVEQTNGHILPPEKAAISVGYIEYDNIEWADLIATWSVGEDLTQFYEDLRCQAERINVVADDGSIEGTEGYVLYIYTYDGWSQYKAKPQSIELLHWKGDVLPVSVIENTTLNALETVTVEDLDCSIVSELLLEEFSSRVVVASTSRIDKIIQQVIDREMFKRKVKSEYEGLGLSWSRDGKRGVMKALSYSFERGRMRDVYKALMELGIGG